MKTHLLEIASYLEKAPYLAYPLALLQIVMSLRWFWLKTRKEVAPHTPKTRIESARFFTVLVSVLIIAFGLLVLLAVSFLQTSSLSQTLVVLGGVVAGLSLLGSLLMAFGLPAYNYVRDLEERCQRLEDRYQIREERLKATELEVQSMKRFLEEAFPTQQKLAFMDSVVQAETGDEYTS